MYSPKLAHQFLRRGRNAASLAQGRRPVHFTVHKRSMRSAPTVARVSPLGEKRASQIPSAWAGAENILDRLATSQSSKSSPAHTARSASSGERLKLNAGRGCASSASFSPLPGSQKKTSGVYSPLTVPPAAVTSSDPV